MFFLPLKMINSFHQVNELQTLTNSVRHIAVLLTCSWWNRKVFLRHWKKNIHLAWEQQEVDIRKGENFSWGFCNCPNPFPCFWESVSDKRRNHDARSSQSVWSLHLKNETSWILCKGVGWSGRYANYSGWITAYNGGAGSSQESQGGLENSNDNHNLCVFLIKNRHKMNS